MNWLKAACKAVCFTAALAVCAIAVCSGDEIEFRTKTDRNIPEKIGQSLNRMDDRINAEVFDLPKIYTLPMDFEPAPEPDPACYDTETYEDETIWVKCWRERLEFSSHTVTANFAEVKIAHPTQFRSAVSGKDRLTTKRMYGSAMSIDVNAVVAINGDYSGYRQTGVIVRQGKLLKIYPQGIDELLIDENGDFLTMRDSRITRDYLSENRIYHAFAFGPVLVRDGKAVTNPPKENYIVCSAPHDEPRTAIGQLGRLHYLLCTVDGRTEHSRGISVKEMAKLMESKNCVSAYNLDGGQSTVMMFHDRIYNVVSNGGERPLTDIVYFATAVPESERNAGRTFGGN